MLETLASEMSVESAVAVTLQLPSEPIEVVGHECLIQRAVANVLSNAQRYASSTIDVVVSADEALTHVVVSDDGPGVALSDSERIFDQFVRVDQARSHDTGGSGLGLAITTSVLRAHGGSVVTQPCPELGGARFVLALPNAPHTSKASPTP